MPSLENWDGGLKSLLWLANSPHTPKYMYIFVWDVYPNPYTYVYVNVCIYYSNINVCIGICTVSMIIWWKARSNSESSLSVFFTLTPALCTLPSSLPIPLTSSLAYRVFFMQGSWVLQYIIQFHRTQQMRLYLRAKERLSGVGCIYT